MFSVPKINETTHHIIERKEDKKFHDLPKDYNEAGDIRLDCLRALSDEVRRIASDTDSLDKKTLAHYAETLGEITVTNIARELAAAQLHPETMLRDTEILQQWMDVVLVFFSNANGVFASSTSTAFGIVPYLIEKSRPHTFAPSISPVFRMMPDPLINKNARALASSLSTVFGFIHNDLDNELKKAQAKSRVADAITDLVHHSE